MLKLWLANETNGSTQVSADTTIEIGCRELKRRADVLKTGNNIINGRDGGCSDGNIS